VRLGEAFLFGLCGLRLEVEGREHLPQGGFIAACALHRSWLDPLLIIRALPLEPRVWFIGSGPTAFDRRWRERLLRHIGGLLPVWRGGRDIFVHVRAAQAITSALADRIELELAKLHPRTVDPPARARHWPWLTRLMR
jgi:hypothetical protein